MKKSTMKRSVPLRTRSRLKPIGKKGKRLASQKREWSRLILSRNHGLCALKGLWGVECWGPIDPAHIRGKQAHPARQFDPNNGVPACRAHHIYFDAHQRSCVGEVMRAERNLPVIKEL